MKQYLKAQYYIPVVAFVFVVLYTMFLLSGGEVRVRTRRNSLNQGGSGYFLFYKLFQRLGYRIQLWHQANLPQKGGCLFYFDYFSTKQDGQDREDGRQGYDREDEADGPVEQDRQDRQNRETFKKIIDWVKQGNVLFLVGIQGTTDPVFYRRVTEGKTFGIRTSEVITTEDLDFSFPTSKFIEVGSDDHVLMYGKAGALAIWRQLGEGEVYLFADHNLMVNRYFHNPHHAVFINELLKIYYTENIYFYEYGTSTGTYQVNNPVMILFRGVFLPLTLHLLLLGLIFVLWKGKGFGKPLLAEPFRRRSIGVHLAAVGGFYQKTKALKIVDSLTRKYFIFRVKQILNLKKNISLDELADIIARYTGKSTAKIKGLLAEDRVVPETTLVMNRKEIHRLISEIRDYKVEPRRYAKGREEKKRTI